MPNAKYTGSDYTTLSPDGVLPRVTLKTGESIEVSESQATYLRAFTCFEVEKTQKEIEYEKRVKKEHEKAEEEKIQRGREIAEKQNLIARIEKDIIEKTKGLGEITQKAKEKLNKKNIQELKELVEGRKAPEENKKK